MDVERVKNINLKVSPKANTIRIDEIIKGKNIKERTKN